MTRKHDLPPKWDGRRVKWTAWRDAPYGSMRFHAPADAFACTGCGWVLDTVLQASGRLMPEPGTTPLHSYMRLSVRRCPGCGLDEVTDLDTWEVWDLDDDDYGDEGSWADEPTLF